MNNREPQPTDGPDYHAEHSFWVARQSADGPVDDGTKMRAALAQAWEAGMAAAKLQAAGIKPARNPYVS